MKTVDKQLLFISSEERDGGTISDFTISMPSHLIACTQHQRMRMVLNDVVMPYTWYNVQDTNNTFQIVVNGVTHNVQIEEGSYHAIQLRAKLTTLLQAYGVSVSFVETSSKFTFTMANPVGTNALVFAAQGAHRLLGFEKSSTNGFVGDVLSSANAVSMMFTDALYLHCDLLNTNVDKRAGDKQTFHLSTAFAKIMINTSPFNNIIFQNSNDDYMLNLLDRRVAAFRMWVTTSEHGNIKLNDDWSFTMKVEVYEDDERTLVEQNVGLGELLRLQLLQNHVHHEEHTGKGLKQPGSKSAIKKV